MTFPVEKELQTLEQFEAWLNQNEGRSTAGRARNDCGCPLATFLRVQLPHEPIQVCCNGIRIGDGHVLHTSLSYEFTRQIDDGRHDHQRVTFTAARIALKSARERTKGGAK